MGLIKIFMPNDYVKSVFQIDIEKLVDLKALSQI